jgi:hypothetical protein
MITDTDPSQFIYAQWYCQTTFSIGIAFLMFQNVVACVLVFYLPCGLSWMSHITLLLPYERYCVCSAMCVMALYLFNYNTDISHPVAPDVLL